MKIVRFRAARSRGGSFFHDCSAPRVGRALSSRRATVSRWPPSAWAARARPSPWRLLARPDVQVVAVCDCNQGSKDYVEYGSNALLKSARNLLGAGIRKLGRGSGFARRGATHARSSRPAWAWAAANRRSDVVEAYYGSRKGSAPAPTRAARLIAIIASCWRRKRIWTRFTSPRPIIGTHPSRSRPCAGTSTCCVRSP